MDPTQWMSFRTAHDRNFSPYITVFTVFLREALLVAYSSFLRTFIYFLVFNPLKFWQTILTTALPQDRPAEGSEVAHLMEIAPGSVHCRMS